MTVCKFVHGYNRVDRDGYFDMAGTELEVIILSFDTYACDIFSLLARHREVSQYVYGYMELQREYLHNTLMRLDKAIPDMRQQLEASSCSPVYGVPLHDHLRIVQKEIAVPIEVCVRRLIEVGLNEEGLFRVAGSASKVRRLKGAFDANLVTSETLALADDHDRDYDVHVVAGALKCYLRELPEPLLTHLLHDNWLEAVRQKDHQLRLKSLWMVVQQIPPTNLANLRHLIKFLAILAVNASINKMTPGNIAIVIAPNLIWAQRETDEQPDFSTLGRNMSLTNDYRSVVENLIEYNDYFFKEDVDFGVIPCVPPSPYQVHDALNGALPATVQPRTGPQTHRRNASADFNRVDAAGGNLAATSTIADCDSPKQPQKTRKKQAPRPPQQIRPVSTCGGSTSGQITQDAQAAISTTSASASPEQIRSKTPPRDGSQQVTPAPASRLHHNNSIKRPTAEPPRPPGSIAPAKPPRPNLPNMSNLENQDRLSAPADDADGKLVPLGFDLLQEGVDVESSSDDSEVFLRKTSNDSEGVKPIGFVVDGDASKDDQNNSPKSSRSFRQSLENVLQLQAAGQPVALPRHSNFSSSTIPNEGDNTLQPVLPVPRAGSTGESNRPVMPPTPVQRTTIPASTATATVPRVIKESHQTSVEKAEPVQRIDKPALPEKPCIMNRSTITVDHSKPQVPEKPSSVHHRPTSTISDSGSTSVPVS
ncbi:Rho GTPase-activating protein 17, partial [Halocaridina rubra]